ncbi:MAG TPA: flagellar biosynthesis anti-sigma factor FlgM [Steroidobacteraceae bacterium]|nr:flagellar biosynthesis anti-sigma factor FlgM [Steroidobacteraceae bacterium]
MSNEISSVDGGGPAAVGTGPAAQRAPATSEPTSSAGNAESVHITGTASQLADLEQVIQGLPAVDPTRVAAVTSSLEQGTYTISSQNIADHLIQLERAFGPAGQQG